MTRKIPEQLLPSTQARSNEAAAKIEAAKAAILRELKTGTLIRRRKEIDRAFLLRRAGLNKWFLRGETPRDIERREDAQSFVDSVNDALAAQAPPDPDEEIARLRGELKATTEKYLRLADTVNDWAAKLRDKRREIHNLTKTVERLTEQVGGTLVPFKRKT